MEIFLLERILIAEMDDIINKNFEIKKASGFRDHNDDKEDNKLENDNTNNNNNGNKDTENINNLNEENNKIINKVHHNDLNSLKNIDPHAQDFVSKESKENNNTHENNLVPKPITKNIDIESIIIVIGRNKQKDQEEMEGDENNGICFICLYHVILNEDDVKKQEEYVVYHRILPLSKVLKALENIQKKMEINFIMYIIIYIFESRKKL